MATISTTKYLVIGGDFDRGFDFVGPFDSESDAAQHGQDQYAAFEIQRLEHPDGIAGWDMAKEIKENK